MASGTPALKIVFAPSATVALVEIWNYNAETRGIAQADRYEAFLKGHIYDLASNPTQGKIVESDPDFRYLVVQKRSKADGHIVGYRIDSATQTIRILRLYHTKQDWRTKIENEEP